MSRRKKLPEYKQVTVEEIAAEGKSIVRVDEKVVFVPQLIPGDVVDIQVIRRKKRYEEGVVTAFHAYSDLRIEPFCEHFGVCGGCKWQHLPYEKQLEFKEKQVIDAIRRIGKQEPAKIYPVLGSADTKFYRNKLEYTFSDKRWLTPEEVNSGADFDQRHALGFHIPGMFDKVLDLRNCYLQPEPSNSLRNMVRAFSEEQDMSYFSIRGHEGFLRNLIIRTASTGEVMVIVSFYHEDQAMREGLLDKIINTYPEITSLMYVINGKPHDSIGDLDVILYKGRDHIFEKMEDLSFKIGPKSFYQTNSQQAYELYKIVRRFAMLTGTEHVYDLYTGTGTIANFLAAQAKKVIGIEYVPEAIMDAKYNADLNKISNTHFFAGDMKNVLTESFLSAMGKPDVIITDPPRAGMHEDVIKTILLADPKKIVYVSCNPATQARDIQLMSENYSLEALQPVDMFPHTHHVESVALLRRK